MIGLLDQKWGALRMIPIKQPETVAAMGTVMTQPKKIQPIARQFVARQSPLQRETPMVEPTMHMVVETGIPYWAARMTVMDEPSSMLKPRVGEWRVRRLPRTRMIWEGGESDVLS